MHSTSSASPILATFSKFLTSAQWGLLYINSPCLLYKVLISPLKKPQKSLFLKIGEKNQGGGEKKLSSKVCLNLNKKMFTT